METLDNITDHIFLVYKNKPYFTAYDTRNNKETFSYLIDSTRIIGAMGLLLNLFPGKFTTCRYPKIDRFQIYSENGDLLDEVIYYNDLFYHSLNSGIMALAVVTDEMGNPHIRELFDTPSDVEYCESIMCKYIN